MKDIIKLRTMEEIKAYSDPYRIKIITFIRNYMIPVTVKEIADSLGEVPAKVHYHVKKLEKAGILELVRTKEIKGIVAKYYFLTAEKFDIEEEKLNQNGKKVYKAQVMNYINDCYKNSHEIVENVVIDNMSADENLKNITILPETLYLTDKQFKELSLEIKEVLGKYQKKKKGLSKWHVLNVVCKIKE